MKMIKLTSNSVSLLSASQTYLTSFKSIYKKNNNRGLGQQNRGAYIYSIRKDKLNNLKTKT
jgi:hypothetical protein